MTVEIIALAVLIFIACSLIFMCINLYEIAKMLEDKLIGPDDNHNTFIAQEIDKIQKHLYKMKNDTIDIKINTMTR